MKKQKRLWTINDTAQFMSLEPDTVRKMARDGRIPAFKLGRVWRFYPDKVTEWLNDQKQKTYENSQS